MKSVIVAAAALLAAAPASAAELIQASFSGTFTGQFMGSIAPVGSAFSGNFQYNTDATATPAGPFSGRYAFTTFGNVTYGGNSYQGPLSGMVSDDGSSRDFRFWIDVPGPEMFVLYYAYQPSQGVGNASLPGLASFTGPATAAISSPIGMKGNFGAASVNASIAALPEPSSWAMMIAGFGLIGAVIRRSRRAALRAFALA